MEYICLFLFLLHVISTSSLLIPNSDVTSPSKRLTLRSIDPLTRRSSAERNFIRFGRSVVQDEYQFRHPDSAAISSDRKLNLNKREALHFSPENADRDFATDSVVVDQLRQSNQNGHLLCLVPDDDSDDHMLCMGPRQNASNLIYVLVDQGEEALANQTDGFLRYARPDIESDRIRKSKSGNFMRLGRSKPNRGMFSRYDRGRDNFMRLGRSGGEDGLPSKKRKHDSFMRLGRDAAGSGGGHIRSSRGRDNFMRLGRTTGDEVYDRYPRRHDSFMRLGRMSPGFDRSERRSDNFMRLGRIDQEVDRSIRRSANFMRLGRRTSNDVPEGYTRVSNVKKSSSSMLYTEPELPKNLKATPTIYGQPEQRSDGFMRLGRDAETNEPVEWKDEEKRSKAGNFMRLGRSVQRIGRSPDEEYDADDSKPKQLASTETADGYPEFVKQDSSEPSSNVTDRRWDVESVDKGVNEANEEFVRESRGRGLLLMFGRPDDSRSADLDGRKCAGYQCAESGQTAARSRSSSTDSAAKTNVL